MIFFNHTTVQCVKKKQKKKTKVNGPEGAKYFILEIKTGFPELILGNTAPKSGILQIWSYISSIQVIKYSILLVFIEFYSEKSQLILAVFWDSKGKVTLSVSFGICVRYW